MLDYHRYRVTRVALRTSSETGFVIPPERLELAVEHDGLRAFLFSNLSNPTGQLVRGDEFEGYVRTARERACALLLDAFYSHFVCDADGRPGDGPVSAAAFVDDVESDPVLVVDGLTKCFRYPGWRLGWAVGPSRFIETINRAASAINGGPSTLMQRAAIQVLEPPRADQETRALRAVFARKRNLMLEQLREMRIRCRHEPAGTFHVWADTGALPPPLNEADAFFRAGLERRVMTVPGRFFDVNPGGIQSDAGGFDEWVRFSFGPPENNLRMGLERLAELIASA